ncbi:hypothetical protein K435DRAFT_929096 [Dendrothele bispora CBS 962.96]|uniref:HAMP domain-containing protein n=1 Tax=Dendrothele bispora (strain CBS 962.96) TaxID=1314807 RepID=A0A4S8L607_DENBC|nr:hypothetical protein K435DRAFT_929096 [Dendrothele bispora CBS 962.96]
MPSVPECALVRYRCSVPAVVLCPRERSPDRRHVAFAFVNSDSGEDYITVERLGQFAKEVTRVSVEVGTEGKLGGQALVLDVEGTWRELTGVVNKLAANLTNQVRSIAKVTKAVALGDLSKQIEVDASGEILDLKNTVNRMVVRLRLLAAEVTRVTMEVGSQGKLGGQANVPDVSGVWWELVRSIAIVTTAVAKGDLTQKIEIQVEGEMATLKTTVNNMVDQLGAFASEVTRVALEVGTQGILGGQAKVEGVQGTWADLTRNVNKMASNLTNQVRSISEVTKAVAQGNLVKFVEVDVQGQLHGRSIVHLGLGSQAAVPEVQGEWKKLTDNVNLMAMNLTNQVRSIANVCGSDNDETQAISRWESGKSTLIAEGSSTATWLHCPALKVSFTLANTGHVKGGEIPQLYLAHPSVAREVDTEGKLGGQAKVANVAGTWKALTDNVNIIGQQFNAASQDDCRCYPRGDLTQKIGGVSVPGEMLNLVNTINELLKFMGSHRLVLQPWTETYEVFNLRDSIQKNTAAREAAELANRSKSEFLANMSHEIR